MFYKNINVLIKTIKYLNNMIEFLVKSYKIVYKRRKFKKRNFKISILYNLNLIKNIIFK